MMHHPGRKMMALSVRWARSYVQNRGAARSAVAEVPNVFKSKSSKAKAIKHFIHIADTRPVLIGYPMLTGRKSNKN